MDPLLDTPELSKLIKIPERTLDQWAYLQKGPAFIRLGRHRRYDPAEVRRWLAEQTTVVMPREPADATMPRRWDRGIDRTAS